MRKDYDNTIKGTTIYVKNNDISRALRKLKKKMQTEKIFQNLKDKQHFEKPSLKRKKARASAVKRWKKYVAQRED
jgi:small subunit ribosomal protein S21